MFTPTDSSNRLRSCLAKKLSCTFTQARYHATPSAAAASSALRGPGTAKSVRHPGSCGSGSDQQSCEDGEKGAKEGTHFKLWT